MGLSKRLNAIYDLIDHNKIVADIGSDHALLPIQLIESNKCKKAYACDIAPLPLQRGRDAIIKKNLSSNIDCILMPGIRRLPSDVNCIVIAGMGCDTIISILEHDLDKAKKCDYLILQSNKHVDHLRTWLMENGFKIIKEDLVYEQHYYEILKVCKGHEILSEKQIVFGKYLYDHPIFLEYIIYRLHNLEIIFMQLQQHHESYNIVKHRIQMHKEILENIEYK